MRPLEIALAFTLAARFLFRNRLRWLDYLPLLVASAQVLAEGYRWQLVPLYGLAIWAGIRSIRLLKKRGGQVTKAQSWQSAAGGLAVLLLALAPPLLLPIPQPRPPGGPYPVGTTTWYFVDEDRTDPYAPNPGTPRRLMVQAWYPATQDSITGPPAPWMEKADIIAPAISKWVELPPFFLDHLVYARSDAYPNAQIEESGPYPLILFSHGFGGFRAQNTSQALALVSQGYFVVAVEHTYAAAITVFPDGSLASHNPDTLPENVSDQVFRSAAEDLIDQWNDDFNFVLRAISRMNLEMESPFFEQIDQERLGLMGHSTGGRAALQFCTRDARCRAGLVMDPWLMDQEVEAFQQGPGQPFLFMFSENWRSGPQSERFKRYASVIPGQTVVFTIAGTGHYDFTDLPALSPLASYLGLKGPIPGDRVLEITISYTLQFFDQTFKSRPAPGLGQSNRDYPEVIFSDWE